MTHVSCSPSVGIFFLLDRIAYRFPCRRLQEALIAEIVEEHAGVEAERREAVIRAENAESELSDAHHAARIVAIGVHAFTAPCGFDFIDFLCSKHDTV